MKPKQKEKSKSNKGLSDNELTAKYETGEKLNFKKTLKKAAARKVASISHKNKKKK